MHNAVNGEDAMDEPLLNRRTITSQLIDKIDLGKSMVFVDFDHTLLACNSTELFIASCKPSIFVAIIEFIVRRCVPWRLSRSPNWFRARDYFCCLAIIALCPGSISRWKRIAPALFKRHVSPAMVEALRPIDLGQVAIITFGMKFVIEALLQDSPWSSVPLIATPTITRLNHFKCGKLVLATQYAGAKAVAAATFITDSLDDYDLLVAAKSGILISPQGPMIKAIERLYIPLRYTASAKYTPTYVVDQLVLVELVLLLISTSQDISSFVTNFAFLPLLLLSIMCVYEIGYFENDMRAARQELLPTLTEAADRFQLYPIVPGAWIWAIAAGVLGNILVCLTEQTPYAELLVRVPGWIAGLVLLRIAFHLYNRPNLRIRLHLYPVLQLLKLLPIILLVSVNFLGAVLIICQIATMWAVYLTYRHGGRSKDIEKELFRVILIAVSLVLLLTTAGAKGIGWPFQLIAVSVWAMARVCKAPVLGVIRRRRAVI